MTEQERVAATRVIAQAIEAHTVASAAQNAASAARTREPGPVREIDYLDTSMARSRAHGKLWGALGMIEALYGAAERDAIWTAAKALARDAYQQEAFA
jgi:hypothetical protein